MNDLYVVREFEGEIHVFSKERCAVIWKMDSLQKRCSKCEHVTMVVTMEMTSRAQRICELLNKDGAK